MDAPKLDVSVVLPTYDEALSLPVIVPRILHALDEAGLRGEVIVVDDDSPDDTAGVAERLATEHRVRVHKRVGERGLGTAVLHGFSMSEAPVCVVMDADGSHPATALPAMVRMILEDKADVVVGSRHVAGGGSRDWPVFSQLKSKLAAALAFGVTSMTDPTTGFMAVRRSLLAGLPLDPIGWKIVLEIVVKAAPVRVAEVPIIFTDRELGESKQSLRVFAQYVAHLGKLYAHRYPSLAELAMFCLVGLLGLLVDMSVVIALKELFQLDTRLCAVAGFSVAVTTNFVLNRRYTFAHGRELPWLFSYVSYVGANLAGLALRVLAIEVFIRVAAVDAGRGYVASNLVGIALATLVNFVGAKYFAFDPARVEQSEPDAPTASAQQPSPWTLPAAAALALCLGVAFWNSVLHAELRAADQGINVTMAENIRESFALLVHPSVFPGGRDGWVEQDLPHLGNLPFYPWLLSLVPAGWGLSGMAALSLLAFAITVLCTARLCGLVNPRAGVCCALLMAGSPSLHDSFSAIGFEPLLTAFGTAGLYAFVSGAWRKRALACFGGGLLLGLGFLTKMWLIVPFVFAVLFFCGAEASNVRRTGTSLGLRRSFSLLCVGFALSAGAHLAFVALTSPDDVPRWLTSVYFSLVSGEGVTAAKLSGGGAMAAHQRSPFYYPLTLYREHFFLLPIFVFGVSELLRSAQPRGMRLLGVLAGACLSVIVLSVPAVKQPAYVLAVQPFLYALAALSLAALFQSGPKTRPANVAFVHLGMGLAAVSWLVVIGLRLSGWAEHVSTPYVLAHGLGVMLAMLLGELWIRRRPAAAMLAPMAALAATLVVVAEPRLVAPPPYPAIAGLLAPHVSDRARAQPSYVASEAGILQGYLGRAGLELEDLLQEPSPGRLEAPTLAAFVLSDDDAGRADAAPLLDWLAKHAQDRTAELDAAVGRTTGFRVFTR